MTNKPLISVIIPVYNVEPYLHKCIDSVLNQTFKDLELILVDDGSTDNSGKICEEYALKDNRVIVIHQNNSGQSSARNNGFKISNGEYICFLDSDDWYSENALEVLFDIMINNDVEISMIKIVETTTENIEFESKNNLKIISSYDCLTNMLKYHTNYVQPCNKLYKRKLIEKIKFPDGKIHEDLYVSVDRYSNINKLGYSEKACMFYRQRLGSTVHSNFSYKSLNYCEALEYVNKRFLEINRKDLYFKHSNKVINCYMNYCIELQMSKIEEKEKLINQLRVKAKKLFKSIPIYKWKVYVIKRFIIFILSLKLYNLFIYKKPKMLF